MPQRDADQTLVNAATALRAEIARRRANQQAAESDAMEWAQLADKLKAEIERLQRELSRAEQEITRLRECRDKAASLIHLANQAMYGFD